LIKAKRREESAARSHAGLGAPFMPDRIECV
jgi:hypothetical protein